MTSSNGNIFHVTGPLCGEFTGPGEFPAQKPVMRSFDVFFDLHQNKRLSKQWWGWWFETQSCSLWRHRNVFSEKSSWWDKVAITGHTSCNLWWQSCHCDYLSLSALMVWNISPGSDLPPTFLILIPLIAVVTRQEISTGLSCKQKQLYKLPSSGSVWVLGIDREFISYIYSPICKQYLFIKAKWCRYASVNKTIIAAWWRLMVT